MRAAAGILKGEKEEMNRKTSYFKKTFALLLAVMMVFTMMPSMAFAGVNTASVQSSSDDGVAVQAEAPKIVVTSNVEFATSGTSSEVKDKPLIKVTNAVNNEINKAKHQSINVSNYHYIKDTYQLEYVEVDGLKIYLSKYEQAGATMSVLSRGDADCPNLNGREIWYRMAENNYPQTQLRGKTGGDITNDISIYFHFKTESTKGYKLTIADNDSCEVYESKLQRVTDEGKSVYSIRLRPDDGQELVSYTVDGKTIPIELTRDNYVLWNNSLNESIYCNYIELEIDKDSEIVLNFQPASLDLQLWACDLANIEEELISNWAGGYLYPLRGSLGDNEFGTFASTFKNHTKQTALIEGVPAKFWFTVNINGYLSDGTEVPALDSLKIYKGDKVDPNALIFDDEDPDVQNRAGEAASHIKNIGGHDVGAFYCSIMKCPDMDKITVVMHYGGYRLEKTFDIVMAGNVKEAKELANYYTDNYGIDKFGNEVYTAEEKLTEGYAKYYKYRNFRYVLRKVYNEYMPKIAQGATESEREALLAEGKQQLDDASIGKGYNAVVWSFKGSDPVMVAVPTDSNDFNKTGTSASSTMQAALEAMAPGNWTYYYSGSQFGAFVNNITWGGANETGKIHVNIANWSSYGFWFYNGKFSDWGVDNYYPYDGDVMWWGGGNVDQYWDWAKLRLYYGDDEKLAEEASKRGIKNISAASAAQIEEAFKDLEDGSGKDFFRRNGQFRDTFDYENVILAIAAIGSVSPDSGDAIKAAREAYDALTSQESKDKVTNYQTLLDAEEAFGKLESDADTDFVGALAGVLTYFNNADATTGVGKLGVGSTKGEWAILSLARNGLIKGSDNAGQAANYMAAVEKAVEDGTLSSSTDYARAVIALTSLGVSAPQNMIEKCEDYDLAMKQGINAASFALIALDSKPYDEKNTQIRDKYISYIINNECVGGGWVYGDDLTAAADADVTAMVIQALAPYYNDANHNYNTRVKAAVDKALGVLNNMQKESGGFESYGLYNAESTAQVVTALTSIGIDPTTWNGKDAVNALLHFYNSADSMFAHQLAGMKDQMATEQSAYALTAYNRFKAGQTALYDMSDLFGDDEEGAVVDPAQVVASAKLAIKGLGHQTVSMKIANSEEAIKTFVQTRMTLLGIKGVEYDIKISELTPAVAGTSENPEGSAGSFTAIVTVSAEVTSEGVIYGGAGGASDAGKSSRAVGYASASAEVKGTITTVAYEEPSTDITVTVSLLGDDIHGDDGTKHTLKAGNLKTWIAPTKVTIPGGSTVADALTAVFSKYGVTVTNTSGNYISHLNFNGLNIGEFDNGKLSGWMYTLNGHHPTVGIAGQLVQNGDRIVFHYTDDYTVEEGSEMWNTPAAGTENGEKTDEELKAELDAKAQEGAAAVSAKARSEKSSKGYIKVTYKPDAETKAFINEMQEQGYTVKYRFFRSTKKASGYKAMLTKSGTTYTNTIGNKGVKYYYKVQVLIYDSEGTLVAKSALKQCKYACRTWTK